MSVAMCNRGKASIVATMTCMTIALSIRIIFQHYYEYQSFIITKMLKGLVKDPKRQCGRLVTLFSI